MDALLGRRLLGGPWPGAKRAVGRASAARSVDSGARAERQTGHGVGAVRMGGGAGGGGAGVRLQRLGRAG
jgi:hypothetical protein